MLELNKGKRKIAMKDKPELIRVQKAKILEAARTLEFCCVREELKGTMVKRPHDCEWTTMLWLEPVDKLHVVEFRRGNQLRLIQIAGAYRPATRTVATARGIVRESRMTPCPTPPRFET